MGFEFWTGFICGFMVPVIMILLALGVLRRVLNSRWLTDLLGAALGYRLPVVRDQAGQQAEHFATS